MTQTLPNPITPAMLALANGNAAMPRYIGGGADWSGGLTGDDVTVATAAQSLASSASAALATPYSPLNQAQKAAIMVPPDTLAVDVTKPRGWIGPQDPYAAPPASTLTAILPTGAVHGTAAIPVVCTGTGFTPFSIVQVDGVSVPTVYTSATSLTATVTPKATAGTQAVTVLTNGISTAAQTFTAS
jgi:hypothetical protein